VRIGTGLLVWFVREDGVVASRELAEVSDCFTTEEEAHAASAAGISERIDRYTRRANELRDHAASLGLTLNTKETPR